MADRPDILTARTVRLAEAIADADDLKQMAQTDRPNDASLDAVRVAYRDTVGDLAGDFGSVAGVETIPLPSERL